MKPSALAVPLAMLVLAGGRVMTQEAVKGPYSEEQICRFAGFQAYPPTVVDSIVKLAGVGPRDTVFDIGWGNGAVAIAAAKTGARAVAIPLCPKGFSDGMAQAASGRLSGKVQFRSEDFFDTDLRSATVVVLFLSSTRTEQLRGKLMKELRPGARIVSANYGMSGCYPADKTVALEGRVPTLPGGQPQTARVDSLRAWTTPLTNTCRPPAAAPRAMDVQP
jgi:hypothetical protein